MKDTEKPTLEFLKGNRMVDQGQRREKILQYLQSGEKHKKDIVSTVYGADATHNQSMIIQDDLSYLLNTTRQIVRIRHGVYTIARSDADIEARLQRIYEHIENAQQELKQLQEIVSNH